MKHSFTQCTSAAGSIKHTSPKLSSRLSLAVLALAVASSAAFAAPKTHFKVAWTIYAGWMPWDYGARKGIVKKWGGTNTALKSMSFSLTTMSNRSINTAQDRLTDAL